MKLCRLGFNHKHKFAWITEKLLSEVLMLVCDNMGKPLLEGSLPLIYTYKTEIPSVCVSVRLFVIYLLAEVRPQVHIFGIGTKPNVLRTF